MSTETHWPEYLILVSFWASEDFGLSLQGLLVAFPYMQAEQTGVGAFASRLGSTPDLASIFVGLTVQHLEIHVKGSLIEIMTELLGSMWKSDLLAKSTEINCQ